MLPLETASLIELDIQGWSILTAGQVLVSACFSPLSTKFHMHVTVPGFYMGAGDLNSPYTDVAGTLSAAAFTQAAVVFLYGSYMDGTRKNMGHF